MIKKVLCEAFVSHCASSSNRQAKHASKRSFNCIEQRYHSSSVPQFNGRGRWWRNVSVAHSMECHHGSCILHNRHRQTIIHFVCATKLPNKVLLFDFERHHQHPSKSSDIAQSQAFQWFHAHIHVFIVIHFSSIFGTFPWCHKKAKSKIFCK